MKIKNIFKNTDKKPKPKKDILKSTARLYYFIILIILLAIDIIYFKTQNFKATFSFKTVLILAPTVIAFFKVLKNIHCIFKASEHIEEVRNTDVRTSVASGAPGAGKTSSKVFDAVVKAERMWEELQYKYWQYLSQPDETLAPEELKDKQDVIEAYEFYNKHDTIPCLWSNIPIWKDGKKANKLTKAHLLQKEKLPIYSVLINDEIGNEFEAQPKTPTKLKPLELMGRFIRHFIDGFWSFTEQEFSKAFIGVRRTTGSNRYFMRQEWVLKPVLLNWIYECLKYHYSKPVRNANDYQFQSNTYEKLMKSAKLSSMRHSKFMRKFKRFINCIGYRKYTYKELGNIENGVVSTDKERKGKFIIPSCLNCNYDDRCYRNLYKAKNKELKPSKFITNIITEEDLKAS